MKAFWRVVTKFYDNGAVKVITSCVTLNQTCRPKSTMESAESCDIYTDYFDSFDEAKAFVIEAQRA